MHSPPSARSTGRPWHRNSGVVSGVSFGVSLSPSGPELKILGPGLDAALASIMAIAIVATADGSWRRLKVCANDTCRWATPDSSRNRSGRWCSMATCGNQTNVRAFRKRVQGGRVSSRVSSRED